MQAVVQKWGNSLGFRIPSLWAKKKTLDDMLEMVSPENIHSEISTGYSVGKEEW